MSGVMHLIHHVLAALVQVNNPRLQNAWLHLLVLYAFSVRSQAAFNGTCLLGVCSGSQGQRRAHVWSRTSQVSALGGRHHATALTSHREPSSGSRI